MTPRSPRRPDVGKLARKGRVDAVFEALHYYEPGVSRNGTANDQSADVRAAAARALPDLGAPGVADALGGALGDPEPAVRIAALEGLARPGVDGAGQIEALVRCVVVREHGAGEVSARALDLLVAWRAGRCPELMVKALLEPEAPEPDEGHRATLELFLITDSRGSAARVAVTQMLIDHLRAARADASDAAAEEILGWLGADALDTILEELDGGTVSPAVIRAAGRLGDARAVGPVVQALESPDLELRVAAANAARALNHTRAVPALLSATQDDHQAVRDAASAALDRMGTAAVIAGLAAVVSARGLGATLSGDLAGLAHADLDEGRGGQQLGAGAPDAATEPAPHPPDEPWQPATTGLDRTPGRPAPVVRQRRGGFLERLLGRY